MIIMSEEESKTPLILGYLAQGMTQEEIAQKVGVTQGRISQVKREYEKLPDIKGIPPEIADRVTGMTGNEAKVFAMKTAAQLEERGDEIKELRKLALQPPPQTRVPSTAATKELPQGPMSSRIQKVIADVQEAKILMSQFPELRGYVPEDLVGRQIEFRQPSGDQVMTTLNLDADLADMKKLALMRLYAQMAQGGAIPGTGQQMSSEQAQQMAQLQYNNILKEFELKLERAKKEDKSSPPPLQGPTETEKKLMSTMEAIQKRLDKEDADKAQKKLIEDVTKPYMEKIGKLTETVDELKKPSTEPKSEFDAYMNMRTKLKAEGLLPEPKAGSVLFGSEGIPVKGEIPAWVVYGPKVIDQIGESLEKRLDRITSKFGLGAKTPPQTQTPTTTQSLINLPPRPFPPMTPMKTTEEKIEAPPKEVEKAQEAKTLVKLPEKPQPPAVISEKKPAIVPKPPASAVKIPTPPPAAKIPTPSPAVQKLTPPVKKIKIEKKTVKPPKEKTYSHLRKYSKGDLEKMKMVQIWKICNDLEIKRGGKKIELIDKILEVQGENDE